MFSLQVLEKPCFSYSQNTLDEISEIISKNILSKQK